MMTYIIKTINKIPEFEFIKARMKNGIIIVKTSVKPIPEIKGIIMAA